MKTHVMCLIAALSIFTLRADAAKTVKPKIVRQSTPITVSVPALCNVGEVVDLSGTFRTVITFWPATRRWAPHESISVNAQGVAGTGEITGRTFQANGEFYRPFSLDLLNGFSDIYTKVWFLVTGAPGPDGSVPSFGLRADVRVTFRANGTVTVKFENFTTNCPDSTGECNGIPCGWD